MVRVMPTWIVAIAVIVVLQTVSSMLTRIVPVISPKFMAEFGWDEGWIGYLAAAGVIGSLFVLTSGIGIIRRLGGVLAFQLTLVIGGISLLLFAVPSLAVALIASIAIGLSNGAANPAGSEVLQRFTPAAWRNLVFSIKQAGVPLGGVIVGLAIPPVVDAFGWRATLVTAAAILLAVTAATWPLRKLIDPPRDPMLAQRLVSLRWTDIIVPLHALSRAPGLWRMAWVGGLLAWPQAVWVTFAATYLVVALGQSLAVAGLVFATMQATSAAGRVLVGWIADRMGTSTVTLALASVASAGSTMAFAFASPDWPLWALVLVASVGGISASGWNGVQIAEVARRSPPGLVAETAAGSVVMVYGSNMLAPAAFAAFVAVTGRFDVAFMLSGAVAMVCLPLLYGIDRAPVKPGP